MTMQQASYLVDTPEQYSVTEVTEVFPATEIDDRYPQYQALSGVRKWIRYAWYPMIDMISVMGTIAAIASFERQGISWIDLGILLFMFNFVGLAGEAGMHRLFAHKSYKVIKPLRILLAVAGSMTGESPILEYVAYHRRHHIYADQQGDPHTPYYIDAEQPLSRIRNIWHSFFGWKYNSKTSQMAAPEKYAKDLLAEPAMVIINNSFYGIVLASFVLPALLGLVLTGTVAGAWTAFLWGGCFRFLVMTLMGDLIIRAGCHLFGTRPFIDQANSHSGNIWFLAIPSLGLAWHNNHHAFPGSALLNIDWWQIDPSGSFISLLEKLGWATNVKRPTPEQVKAKRLN
ncbi:acyl-CoA desaturase [Nostoc sp. CMAA1605]|uniref:acyl-CoA desaturase n=1 Tax=Nostoc sp. CMAA1605 TaxID=2055159 RepID=UPI001F268DC1|nr:acyl-CoA desaturase [Nostoc sp. CMAA1605]MCF4966667.1 acyl-CoA desaturase [Nostoc sp. CMAA1605]